MTWQRASCFGWTHREGWKTRKRGKMAGALAGDRAGRWSPRCLLAGSYGCLIRLSAFIRRQRKGDPADLCMVTGKIARRASQHPKGVIPTSGNAKLISSNDETGFTFRGRFTSGEQAATVSYEASQKALTPCAGWQRSRGRRPSLGAGRFCAGIPRGTKSAMLWGVCPAGQTGTQGYGLSGAAAKDPWKGCKSKLPETAGVVIAGSTRPPAGGCPLPIIRR